MSDSWSARPPAPCHRTGKDEPADGQPYFTENYLVAEVVKGPSGPQVLPRIKPIVHAASWIKTICQAPGSPFVLRTQAQAAQDEADRVELDGARLRIEELEAEVALLREAPGVDVQALAGALVVPLSDHFSRKTGPKPQRAA